MTLGKKLWQTLAFVVIVAMLVGSVPTLTVNAQEAVVASTVRGELNEQFAKHYLELRVTNPSNPVRIVMDYNPQDRQELGSGAGFYVFDEAGFQALVNGAQPGAVNLATGALETSTGVKQKVATIGNPVGTFTVVPFNDTNVAFDYTLRVENALLVDGSGQQVTDPSAPAADDTAESATTTEAATTEAATATATPAATTATTSTVSTATAVATTAPAAAATPRAIKVDELEGELNERFAKHYYELEVQDISRRVVIEMTYDPQDSQALDNGFNFYVFDENQFRNLASLANNTAAGELISGGPKMKRAIINQPFRTYTVVVANDSNAPAAYTLTVDNAILVDGSGQSITAQEMGATTATTTTATTTASTATTGTTTSAAATTTPAAATTTAEEPITPPTTYTVQSGDTLGTIARRAYGNLRLYEQLCAFNNIADCNRIEIGDQIQVPVQSELGNAPAATVAAATPTPAPTTAASTAVTTTAPVTTTTTAAPAATAAPAEEGTSSATGDIVTTASTYSVLDTLGLLLDLLELEQDQTNNIKAILQSGEYTFFAPTDTAFTSLDEATLEELIANPAQLATVLKGHIVSNEALSSSLTNGSTLTTLAGTTLPVTVSGGTVTVGGAAVVQPDVMATNGVIHIINSVLVPAQ